jgi:inner membrane transporter RhtA
MSTDAAPSTSARSGIALIIGSISSVQFGAAFARQLFGDVGPAGVVLLRQGFAALVLLAVARPHLRGRSAAEWRTVVLFGVVLSVMNLTFYEAVARLPLGIAVTIELLGPLGLAVALSRRLQEFLWCAVAVAGVLLLSDGGGSINLLGVLFALIAAAGWASYILLIGALGSRFQGIDGLALAMAVAAVISSPFGLGAGHRFLTPRVALLGLLVATLSAIIPFTLEVSARRLVAPGAFGVLMSLSPAVATLSGFLILHQRLDAQQLVGMVMVALASAATVRATRRRGMAAALDDRVVATAPG